MRLVRLRAASVTAAVLVALVLPSPVAAAPTWLVPGTLVSDPSHEAADVHVAVAPGGDAVVVWREQVAATYVVLAAHRTAGQPWGAPQTLRSGPELPYDLTVALGDGGYGVAGWVTHAASGAQRVRLTRRSPDGTWEPSKVMTGDPVKGDSPAVAIGPTGRAAAAWHFEAMGGGQIVGAVAEPGEDWFTEAASKFSGALTGLRLALDGTGAPTVAWQQVLAGSMRVQGNSWTPEEGWMVDEVTLSDTTYNTSLAELVPTGTGHVAALLSRFNGSTYRLFTRTQGPGGWAGLTPVTGETGPMGSPGLAVDGAGRGTLVWLGFNGSEYDARAMTQDAVGTWSGQQVLSAPGTPVMPPTIALDAAGTATVVWVAVSGPDAVLRSRSRPADGGWGATADVGTAHSSLYANGSVDVDGAGNAVVGWEDKGAQHTVAQVAALDAVGPALGAAAVPATAYAGKSVAMSVPPPSDPWSGVSGVTWDFGDGGSAAGTSVQHAWTTGGAFTVDVRAADGAGNVTSRTAVITVTGKPVLSKVKLSRTRLHLDGKAKTRKSRLTFTLDTSATVALEVRKLHGSLKTRMVKGGLSAGPHSFVLRTKLGGVHLKPGKYRVRLIARNPAGKGAVWIRTLRVKAAS